MSASTFSPNGNGSADILTRPIGANARPRRATAPSPPPDMDRKLDPRPRQRKRMGLIGLAVFAVAAIVWYAVQSNAGTRVNVAAGSIATAVVATEGFQEYVTVTGQVLPRHTVYLDAVAGGRVEEIYLQEGAALMAGFPILRLSNDDMQLRLINAEAQRIEQINRLQDTRFRMEQNALSLRQQLAELDYNTQRLQRDLDRKRALHDQGLISDQEYEEVADEYQYFASRRHLTLSAYQQDSLRMAAQVTRMEGTVASMEANQQVIERILDNLVVRAPVDGELTALDVNIGELHSSGSRLGQIDRTDGYKLRAEIDEFYLSRVRKGQRGTTQSISGETFDVQIEKIYPEVNNGRFEVDAVFLGTPPDDIRRGQTVRYRLALSESSMATVVPRGGFHQSTGGNWVYVVDASGDEAARRTIRLGRQNDQYFEVLDGLTAGERVITSAYDRFGDADLLKLN